MLKLGITCKFPFFAGMMTFHQSLINFEFGHRKFMIVLFQDFHEEHAWQAFRRRDKNSNGYISAKDFEEILLSLKGYLLTPFVKENIITVSS